MSNQVDWVGEALRATRKAALNRLVAVDSTPVEAEPDDSDEGVHTGVMIALFPDRDTARQLAVRGGEKAKNLHVTLAILGDDDDSVDLTGLAPALQAVASQHAPLAGTVSGHGYFTGGSDGVVTYAGVDLPGLPDLRHELVQAAEASGHKVSRVHGFTPHMTLAYGEKRDDVSVPNVPLSFNHIALASGKDRLLFPLGGDAEVAADMSDGEENNKGPKGKHTYTHPDYMAGGGISDEAMPPCVECGQPYGDDAHSETLEDPSRAPVTTVERIDPKQISADDEPDTQRSFVTQYNGHTIFTAPATASSDVPVLWERAASSNDFMLWMQGRFVGAEKANRNNAFWTTGDLEMGEPTVQYGPLNWLHEERHIIGCIADAKMVLPEQSKDAEALGQPYIAVLTPIYRWVYPQEAAVVEMASDAGQLWYSMECVSKAVECAGEAGCGASVPYIDYMTRASTNCAHLRERGGVRRFVDPTFLGGAVIVPPVRPGWASADAAVLRENAHLVEQAYEQAGRPDMSSIEWEQLMGQVLRFAS